MNRRIFLATAAAGIAGPAIAETPQAAVPEAIRNLKPMTEGIRPITDDERRARMEKARGLMRESKLDAILCAAGSTLFYYTGQPLQPGHLDPARQG